jgi:hypothetical protein
MGALLNGAILDRPPHRGGVIYAELHAASRVDDGSIGGGAPGQAGGDAELALIGDLVPQDSRLRIDERREVLR